VHSTRGKKVLNIKINLLQNPKLSFSRRRDVTKCVQKSPPLVQLYQLASFTPHITDGTCAWKRVSACVLVTQGSFV